MAHLEYTSSDTKSATSLPLANVYRHGGKRCFDLFMVLVLLPIFLPILGILILLNTFATGSPIFGHKRIGQGGRYFLCWKLRTMRLNSDQILTSHLAQNPTAAQEWETNQKLKNDPRVTAFGRFLRRTSLDEFPQIWNVISGDMSFVGPRPITRNELRRYGPTAREYLSVRPGVTGQWQVFGRGDGCYKERIRMDHTYCHAMSVHRDIMLILMTALVLIKATGR